MPATEEPITGWREKDDRTIREVRRLLAEQKLDAIIPWKPVHIAYLTNVFDEVHASLSWEESSTFLVIPLDRDAFIVGNHQHAAGAAEYGVHPWWLKPENRAGDWFGCDRNVKVLADEARRRGLGRARIGYEKKWLPAPVFEKLAAALADVTWVPADRIVPQVRLAKTAREQELMRKAVRGGFGAMDAYMDALRRGADRAEAQLVRAKKALDLGVDWVGGAAQMAWTGGVFDTPGWWDEAAQQRYARSTLGRNWLQLPADAPICVTHFETRCQYYFSDIAWHEFVGPPPRPDELIEWGADWGSKRGRFSYRELREDYDVIRAVQHGAINQIRPGMDQIQARAAVETYLGGLPEYARHGQGYFIHSLGLEVHEDPVLTVANPIALPEDGPIFFEPGAVCSSEWFSRHWTVEDPYILRPDGSWEPLAELRGCVPAR